VEAKGRSRDAVFYIDPGICQEILSKTTEIIKGDKLTTAQILTGHNLKRLFGNARYIWQTQRASPVIVHVVFACLTRLPAHRILGRLCKTPAQVRFTAIMF